MSPSACCGCSPSGYSLCGDDWASPTPSRSRSPDSTGTSWTSCGSRSSRSSISSRDGDASVKDEQRGSEHPTVGTYVKVALVLTVVTALEVGVIYVRRLAPIVVPLLLAMSAAKFALVALFFMHLWYEIRVPTLLFCWSQILESRLTVSLQTMTVA